MILHIYQEIAYCDTERNSEGYRPATVEWLMERLIAQQTGNLGQKTIHPTCVGSLLQDLFCRQITPFGSRNQANLGSWIGLSADP